MIIEETNINSDLSSFSREELTVMNQILTAIYHSKDFGELLKEIYLALNSQINVQGCAMYRLSDNKMGLHLVSGYGIYKQHLPDLIPQGSDLHKIITQNNGFITPSAQTKQLSLFEDQPITHYAPIIVDGTLEGALVVIDFNEKPLMLKVIFAQAISALELLCKADNITNSLSIRAHFSSEQNDTAEIYMKRTAIKLTPREREVLMLMSLGKSNKEIASELYISASTCKRHVENILQKLNAANRAAAVAYWFSNAENITTIKSNI